MWLLLVAPVVIVAVVSIVAALRRPPHIAGVDPPALRTVVSWRDSAAVAAEIAGEAQEQLRQLVGVLAERRFIFSSSIERGADGPVATVDVTEERFELRARTYRAGGWLLWVQSRGAALEDSDDLRQLLTGLHRSLEERGGEGTRWHRREQLARGDAHGAPSPFYVE